LRTADARRRAEAQFVDHTCLEQLTGQRRSALTDDGGEAPVAKHPDHLGCGDGTTRRRKLENLGAR